MLSAFLRGLLGALGVIKKSKAFTADNNPEFVRSLEPAQVVLTGARDANFVQGWIQGRTDSFWQHGVLYVGHTAAAMVRQIFPELLANKKIPLEAQEHEIIEADFSQGSIIVSTLDKYMIYSQQMVGYIRPISTVELMKILYRIYSLVGSDYDTLEAIGDALPDGMQDIVPNDPKKFDCSSAIAFAWLPVEIIVIPGVAVGRATPSDLNRYLEPNLAWRQTRYNW
jgi:hypothetical protein